ncbi:transposase [Rhodocaloribacter litoris]|uniref:transposase n=1 Tax=Rhodocaloribacter litoris TaxID=2558931 RepID=UPI001422E4B7|nr:transposase [Rhodocaloribacter litoris]
MLQVTLDANQVQDLFTGDDPLRALLEPVLNQILEAETTGHLGAEPYARTQPRQAYGYRARRLTTRVGMLTLCVPRSRDDSSSSARSSIDAQRPRGHARGPPRAAGRSSAPALSP